MKMLSVPSVTMNGGRLSRVTRAPLRHPASSADRDADQQGEDAGHAVVRREVGHDSIDRMQIAPTDRSMPAVRMTSV